MKLEPDRLLVRRIGEQAKRDGWSPRAARAHEVLASNPSPANEQRARAILDAEREQAK